MTLEFSGAKELMMKPLRSALAAVLALLLAAPLAFAQAMVDGEVVKIDKAQSRIRVKHAEIKNLDLPAMTMAFKVKDPAMLDQVQEGDRVKFSAEKVGGQFTITAIGKAR
jgi:Cu(I)/Ag(I) efflux system periplasmic protein CusF